MMLLLSSQKHIFNRLSVDEHMMGGFIERLARSIEKPDHDEISQALTDVSEVMRIWRFFRGQPCRQFVLKPFTEDGEFPCVSADDVARLEAALLFFIGYFPERR